MNLLQFESYIQGLANVGTTVLTPAVLREEVRNGGRWMEMNYSFYYMEAYRTLTQALGDRYVALSARPKRVELLRQRRNDGTYLHLDQVDAKDYDEEDFAGTGTPSVFWLDGQGASVGVPVPRLVLNMTPTAALNLEMIEVRLTDWDSLGDTDSHWLFDYGRVAFSSQVLWQLYAGPILRDTEMAQAMLALRKEGLDTLLNYDDELRRSLRSEEMRFGRNV